MRVRKVSNRWALDVFSDVGQIAPQSIIIQTLPRCILRPGSFYLRHLGEEFNHYLSSFAMQRRVIVMGALTSSDMMRDGQGIPAQTGDSPLPILLPPSNLSAIAQMTCGDSFFFFVQEIFR